MDDDLRRAIDASLDTYEEDENFRKTLLLSKKSQKKRLPAAVKSKKKITKSKKAAKPKKRSAKKIKKEKKGEDKPYALCIGGGDAYTNWTQQGFRTFGYHDNAYIKKDWNNLTEKDALDFLKTNDPVRFLFIDNGSDSWLTEITKRDNFVHFLSDIIDEKDFTFVLEFSSNEEVWLMLAPILEKVNSTKYLYMINTHDRHSYMMISTHETIGDFNHSLINTKEDAKERKIITKKLENPTELYYFTIPMDTIYKNDFPYDNQQELVNYIYDNIF